MEIPCIIDYDRERKVGSARLAYLENKLKEMPEPDYTGVVVNHALYGPCQVVYRRRSALRLRLKDGTAKTFTIGDCLFMEWISEEELAVVPDEYPRKKLQDEILQLRDYLLKIKDK